MKRISNEKTNAKLYHTIKNVDKYIFEQCLNFDKVVNFEDLRCDIEGNSIIDLASQKYQLRTLATMLRYFKQLNNL